jgi:hypothetical protein
MPDLQRFCILYEFRNTFMCVLENQLLEKNLACGGAKKGVMLVLGYIYPNDKVFLRASDDTNKLTVFIVPGTFILTHNNLLLASFCLA